MSGKSEFLRKLAERAAKAKLEFGFIPEVKGLENVLPVPEGGSLDDLRSALIESGHIDKAKKRASEAISAGEIPSYRDYLRMKGFDKFENEMDFSREGFKKADQEYDELVTRLETEDQERQAKEASDLAEKIEDFPNSNPKMAAKNQRSINKPENKRLLSVGEPKLKVVKAVAPLGAIGFQDPTEIIGDAAGAYDDMKRAVLRKAAQQMNFANNPDDEEYLTEALSMGADPINAIPGVGGLGLGLLQGAGEMTRKKRGK